MYSYTYLCNMELFCNWDTRSVQQIFKMQLRGGKPINRVSIKLLSLLILRFERQSAFVQQNFARFRLSKLLKTASTDTK
jgi:hypothetical protein